MEPHQVERVRAFNRTVTQRVGALYQEYLGRSRPLGASRVLGEIDEDGTDTKSLRIRLDLDSGYLSRLLGGLEHEGLVSVGADPRDGRVRTVRLTPAGRAERRLLDETSSELARSILGPLSQTQRARLSSAMQVVERLLTASLVEVGAEDPTSPAAEFCLRSYAEELSTRFSDGSDPDKSISATADELTPPCGLFLLARLHDEPIGCGALKFVGNQSAEIKRMWVAGSARGLGIGRRILAELEGHAASHGASLVRLETNGALTEAIGLYRSAGFREVEPFNDEVYAHHWFEKPLPPFRWAGQ